MLARVKERVQFVSNGLELAGVLQLPDGLKKGERRAAFLVLHGFGSNKDGGNVVTVSNLLTGLGYATLRFDMRGCGDSQGARGRTICLEQVEDTRAALDYLSRNENVDTRRDRKSTRLNSSHLVISYAVFCLKKKKKRP